MDPQLETKIFLENFNINSASSATTFHQRYLKTRSVSVTERRDEKETHGKSEIGQSLLILVFA